MRTLSILFLSAFFFSTLCAQTITFGVVPQQSPLKLISEWQPVIKYLENKTGNKIILKIERSIPEFEKKLYGGEYDVAYMNPYHYAVAHKKIGYVATVRDVKKLTGILVVNKNSGISDVTMLKGKTFLFPAPDAFAATLITKYELLKYYGIDVEGEKNFRYVNSHDSVYKGVARGIGDVGGGIERTFDNLNDAEAKESLAVLYKTKSYPSHPFAIKPSLSKQEQEKITKALLELPKTILDSLNMKQLIETKDSEYDNVRDITAVIHSDSE